MCNIIVTRRPLLEEEVWENAIANPHGVGFAALLPDGHWLIRRALSPEKIEWKDVQAKVWIWHFRLATAGFVSLGNCQPVSLYGGEPGAPCTEEIVRGFLVHNGHIVGLGDREISDTVDLARRLLLALREDINAWRAVLEIFGDRFVVGIGPDYEMVGQFHRVRDVWMSSPLFRWRILSWRKRDAF